MLWWLLLQSVKSWCCGGCCYSLSSLTCCQPLCNCFSWWESLCVALDHLKRPMIGPVKKSVRYSQCFINWANLILLFSILVISTIQWQTVVSILFWKAWLMRSGFKPGAAGWKAPTNPLGCVSLTKYYQCFVIEVVLAARAAADAVINVDNVVNLCCTLES